MRLRRLSKGRLIAGEVDMRAAAFNLEVRRLLGVFRLHLFAEKMNKTEGHKLCSSLVARLDQLASTEALEYNFLQ
jgi:hypothetical protein